MMMMMFFFSVFPGSFDDPGPIEIHNPQNSLHKGTVPFNRLCSN